MLNKSKVAQPISTVRNSLLVEIQTTRNSDLNVKNERLGRGQWTKFRQLLKLIDKGGQKVIQQNKAKQNILDKINLSLVQLSKPQKLPANLKVKKHRNKVSKETNKRHKQIWTEETDEIGDQSTQRKKQWKSVMNQNQLSIRFPQIALVKETLVIQQSLISEKRSKEKQKEKNHSLRKQERKVAHERQKEMNLYKRHTKIMNNEESAGKKTGKSSPFAEQSPFDMKVSQWTISKWN